MLIIDKMLASGIKFVLGKVAAAVDAELNDDSRLREELLAAQMRLEAEDYVDRKLASFEVVLDRTMQQVAKGRERLSVHAPTHEDLLSPDAEEAEQAFFDQDDG